MPAFFFFRFCRRCVDLSVLKVSVYHLKLQWLLVSYLYVCGVVAFSR